jgi:hypothetical protein
VFGVTFKLLFFPSTTKSTGDGMGWDGMEWNGEGEGGVTLAC